MFSSLTSSLGTEIETLKSVLDTHDKLRALIFPAQASSDNAAAGSTAPTEGEKPVGETSDPHLGEIRKTAPPKSSWQVYDHCAAFTRLYAVYEHFVENLVSDYLGLLPALYPQYEELPPGVTKQHRVGVGQILLKVGKDGPYKDLQEKEIIRGLSHGLLGNPEYTLFPDAFLVDPQNYRAEALVKVFSYIGFENCWPWVEKHPLMKAFMEKYRDSTETPKTILHDFVENRNKASHTAVGDIVAVDEIKSIADFVVVLSETLAQFVMKQVIQRRKTLGEVTLVGDVLHKFSGNIVGAKMSAGQISIDDELIVWRKHACFNATVVSIKIKDTPYKDLEVHDGQEIGLKLTLGANKGDQLMRVKPTQLPAAPAEPQPEPIPEQMPEAVDSDDVQAQPDEQTGLSES